MPTPRYFKVRKRPDGNFETEGDSICRIGYQLPSTVSETPDGTWAEWEWDGEGLTVRTDRYGFMPLFYWHDESSFAISTSMIELLRRGAPTAIDTVALSVFLHLGYYLDDTTAFRDIRTPPPNGLIRWDGAPDVRDRRPEWREEQRTYPQLVDGFIDLFRGAMDRRRPHDERFAVPLSGGLDSRHILLELLAQGHRPAFAVTSRFPPPKPSPDVEPAAQLAAAAGVEHVVVGPPPLFESEYRQNLLQHLCTDENGWILALADHMRRHGIRASYDGIGGDLWGPRLFDAERMALHRAERYDELAEALLGRDASPMASMLGRDFGDVGDRDAAVHALAEELARYRNMPDPSVGFLMFNRKRREISHSACAILVTLGVVHSPFVDHELFDFLASAPQEVVWSGPLHREVIRTAYPDFAEIPYAANAPAVSGVGTYARFGAKLLRYSLDRNPAWIGRTPRMLAQALRAACSRRYRAEHRWMTPPRLMHLIMLDEARRDATRLAADFANEP